MKNQLKRSIRSFYVEKDNSAILEIEKNAASIAKALNLSDKGSPRVSTFLESERQIPATPLSSVEDLILYCKSMKMSYSYKAVLIMALFELHDKDWRISISRASEYFNGFYSKRRAKGLPVELKKCIYQNPATTFGQIAENLIANPVKALVACRLFEYEPDSDMFSLSSDLKDGLTEAITADVLAICRNRLEQYYSR